MHFISIYDGDGSGDGDDGGVGGKNALIAPVYISLWCGKFNLLSVNIVLNHKMVVKFTLALYHKLWFTVPTL